MQRPVHAVVVAFHAPEALDGCLRSLEGRIPVTVVDNSSSSNVRAVTTAHGAAYVDPGTNLGFGTGVNLALERLLGAEPVDLLLLNPDALLYPDTVERLSDHLHAPGNEHVAALTPRLLGIDGSEQRVMWPFPSPARAWAEALGLGRFFTRCDFAIGAALLLRWEAVEEVGLFDERFFLYAEETDWQRRAANRGWRSTCCETEVGRHAGGGTSDDPVRREALFHAAQETYVRKWWGPAGWLAYRGAVLAGAAVRAGVLGGERRAAAARRFLLYLRGPRRAAGALLPL